MKGKRRKMFCLVFLFLQGMVMAQNIPQGHPETPDSLQGETVTSRHALYAGAGGGSNLIYLGSTISGNHTYASASVYYGFKDELFASVSAFHLSHWSPYLAFYSLSLNYSHTINSWFDYSVSIYRYEVAPSLSDTLFADFFYGDVTAGVDWRLLYTKVSLGVVPEEGGTPYLQVRNSRYFETPLFMHKKAWISFDPNVNMLFGTMVTSRTIDGVTIWKTHPKKPWEKVKWITTTTTTYSKSFGMMEVDLSLPVAFNTERLTIEAEAQYIIPVYKNQEMPGAKGFVFLLNAFFRIF